MLQLYGLKGPLKESPFPDHPAANMNERCQHSLADIHLLSVQNSLILTNNASIH